MPGVRGIAQRAPLFEKDCPSSSSPEPLSTLFGLLQSYNYEKQEVCSCPLLVFTLSYLPLSFSFTL